jgi:hypothetical protein
MANTIRVKRSAVSGKVPTTGQCGAGELAVNTNDVELYFGTGSAVAKVHSKYLADGTPAFLDGNSNLRSISEREYSFALSGTSLNNVYLKSVGVFDSNVCGFIVPHKSLIVGAVIALSATASANVDFQIRNAANANVLTTVTLGSSNRTHVVTNLGVVVNSGLELACYVTSTSAIDNPFVRLLVALTD